MSGKVQPVGQVSIRAFGREKTDIIDPKTQDFEFKRTELKIDIPKTAYGEQKPIHFHWEDVNVYTPGSNDSSIYSKLPCHKKVESKHICQNITGIANPGSLMAIMGASGAGKTTLLNVLNFRNKGKLIVDGRIKINGRDIYSNAQLSEISAYIEQEDMFIGYLKVREQIRFQAELKMRRDISKEDRDKKIEQILIDLNLKKCEDTLIGVPDKDIKGISGGERRRLSFACAMLTDPNLLFCDEPTSGLDSFMAMSIVDTLRKLADKGKTIICTIHQPSSEIFQKFDRLCLLAEGRLAFIGDSSDVNKFFETQGYPIPQLYNPADHFIKTLAVIPTDRENSLSKIDKICEGYLKCYSYSKNDIAIKEANMLEDNLNYDVELSTKVQYRSNVLVQFRWLLWRSSLSVLRDPRSSYIALIQTIFISVILGLVYLQQKYDQPGVQNINGVLFLMLLNSSFSNMFAVINLYSFELPIMLKEHRNGMYRVISYYLAKTVVDLPLYTFITFIYVTILYWMANLNNGSVEYITAVVIIIFVVNVSIAFGSFISAAAPTPQTALALAAPILIPLMLFSGFFLNNGSVPDYFIWLQYISWFKYSNELLAVNQWATVTSISCNNVTGSLCYRTGAQVLTALDYSSVRWVEDWCALVAIMVAYRIMTFIVLLIKSYRK